MTRPCRIMLVLVVAALSQHGVQAAGLDPCGALVPPGDGRGMAVQTWTEADLGPRWTPPACSGWTVPGLRSLIAISGRFELAGGRDAVLARFGAVSATVGVRFWSVTKQRWGTLITAAHALDAAGHPRADFTASEMLPGTVLTYSQTDNGAGTGTYRMRVLAVSADRIVLTTENTTTIRFMLLPLFSPGELQTLYVLEQSGQGAWAYLSLTRTAAGASPLLDGYLSSGINRAAAMFRHVAGVPTDQDPPAAP